MKVKTQKAPLVRLMKLGRDRRLRRWELRLNEGLLSREGPRRFCATVVAEALLDIYSRRHIRNAKRALTWLQAKGNGWLLDFENVCDVFDIDPALVRSDVLDDVRAGRTKLGSRLPC